MSTIQTPDPVDQYKAFRRLLSIDFALSLAAGSIYFIFFDFLIGDLGLPTWVAQTQLTASFLFGIYGVLLFASKTSQRAFFRLLIFANFVYATFAGTMGLILFLNKTYGGSLLLLGECAFVTILANLERRTLTGYPRSAG